MNLGQLFGSLEGRINRKPYWIGTVLLIVAAIVLGLIILVVGGAEALVREDGSTSGVSTLVSLLILAASVPIVVKRLQDRNKSAHYAWLLYAPALISTIGDMIGLTGTAGEPNPLGYALALFNFIIGVWFFIELGFLRGTVGPNQYGADPIAPQPAH